MLNLLSAIFLIITPFMLVSFLISKCTEKRSAIFGSAIFTTIIFNIFIEELPLSHAHFIALSGGLLINGFFYLCCWRYFIDLNTKHGDGRAFTVWPIFGTIIPPIGAWVGWKYMTLGAAVESSNIPSVGQSPYKNPSVEQIVDFIDDNATSSTIASNSGWLHSNWHPLSYEAKVQWVKDRLELIEIHFRSINSGISFVKAIQDVDKSYIRNKSA